MKKYYSEAFEAMHGGFLAFFEAGIITEAEFREFEADCFIDEDETPQEEKPANSLAMATQHESA